MPDDRSSEELAKLQKKLYQRGAQFGEERSSLSPLDINQQKTAWSHNAPETTIMPTQNRKHFPFVKFIFVVSLIFFIGAVGLATFQYFIGLNVVSGTNIDVSVEGPEKVNAGEVLQISVATANRNQKDLEEVTLSAVFPVGTKEAGDSSKNLRELRESIGTITSGQASIKTFQALVYGEENQKKTIEFTLTYRIAGSNAVFTKKDTYNFTIGSSPVRVTAALPEEVNSGQPITLNIQAVANTQTSVADLAVLVSYPSGFTFVESEPAPTNSTNVWSLANLAPGQTKNIVIKGKLEGQDDDVKSFQIHAGTLAEPTDQELAVEYNNLFKTVTLRRPFVDLKILLADSRQADTAIDSGKVTPIDIEWTNTLPVEIRNGQIEVIINGEVVDESLITNRGGNYNADTNTITWRQTDAALGVIKPGATARVSFGLVPRSLLTGGGEKLSRPEINLRAKFTGVRVEGENVNTPIEVVAEKNIKINTVAQFLSRGLYHTGSFAPVGPMPPKVGQETLYTIEWTVLNSTNDIKEAKITAVLPTGLRFVGSIVPTSENVTYNAANHTVSWDMGNIRAGSAVGGGRREVAFQIGLTPSVNQVSDTPTLLQNINFTGIDTFTQKVLNVASRDINTRLADDPLFKSIESQVVP